MRNFLIILETIGISRDYEILDSTYDSMEAIDKLITNSDQWESSIVAGQCKVYITTFIE